MTPQERLQNVQARLDARGMKDIKFAWNHEELATKSRDEVVADVANVLEAYLDGKCSPLPPFNDLPEKLV